MKELLILKLFCKDRDNWTKYHSFIQGLNLDKELLLLFSLVNTYYEEYPEHTYLGAAELKSFFTLEYSSYKSAEIIEKLIDDIFQIEVSDSLIKDYIESVLEKDTAAKVINKLLKVVDESETGLLLSIEEDIQKFKEATLKNNSDGDSLFLSTDLESLLEEEYYADGINWRLKCLQDDVGPLHGCNLVHIFARPECFTSDTEVLTSSGWIFVDQVTPHTEIGCVDLERNVTFERPSHIEVHDEEEMYHIHDTLGRVDLCVSGGHQMVYEYGRRGDLRKKAARDMIYFQGVKHHVAGYATGSLDLTFEDRLQIAYQADGHTRNYKGYGYTFSFKKQEKIKRLRWILDNLKYEYTIYKDGNKGHVGFYIKSKMQLHKDFNWVNLKKLSLKGAQDFVEELSYWDASRRTSTRFKYDTASEYNADIVQAVAALAGYNCHHSVYTDTRADSYKDVHTLHIRTKYASVDGSSIKKESLVNWKGTVYCFTVSTGMLLVRRNNAVAVCGNTGKTSFVSSEITNFLRQLKDDESIIWFNNEQKGSKVALRLYSSMLNVPLSSILANPSAAKETFLKRGGNRLKLYDSAFISIEEIGVLCDKYKPRILVIDQGDKISFKGSHTQDSTVKLKNLYIKFRELAKSKVCDIITVGQAGAEAHGKKWLEQIHMDSSRTGKPGELDLSIGIGVDLGEGKEHLRYLHINKNKLTGIHSKRAVVFDSMVGRYSDMEG